MAWAPGEGGGGGLQKWASVPGPLFCVRTDVGAGTQILARKSPFHEKNFPPQMCSQTDQRDVGIILSHRCWGSTPRPPPPPPPARQVGQPRPEPPLPARRPRGGGGGQMGFPTIPPPPPRKAMFFPPCAGDWVRSLRNRAASTCPSVRICAHFVLWPESPFGAGRVRCRCSFTNLPLFQGPKDSPVHMLDHPMWAGHKCVRLPRPSVRDRASPERVHVHRRTRTATATGLFVNVFSR